MNKRACKSEFLFHTSREIPCKTVFKRRKVTEAEELLEPFGTFLFRDIIKVCIEDDIFHDRKVFIESELLRHIPDLFLDLLTFIQDGMARYPRLTRVRVHNRRQHPQNRCLAAAVRTDEPVELSLFDIKVEVMYDDRISELLCKV